MCSVGQKQGARLPLGHITPPAGQAVGSKCPFLAAEIVQKNNRVIREASIELQEDVKEVSSVGRGKQSHLYFEPYSQSDMSVAKGHCLNNTHSNDF